jgi:hypothetical protein
VRLFTFGLTCRNRRATSCAHRHTPRPVVAAPCSLVLTFVVMVTILALTVALDVVSEAPWLYVPGPDEEREPCGVHDSFVALIRKGQIGTEQPGVAAAVVCTASRCRDNVLVTGNSPCLRGLPLHMQVTIAHGCDAQLQFGPPGCRWPIGSSAHDQVALPIPDPTAVLRPAA